MKIVKEYLCNDRTPTIDELKKSINIANADDCVVKLNWFSQYVYYQRYDFGRLQK